MSNIDWDEIQIRFEGGESPLMISRSLKGRPTKQAIYQKAKKEGWEKPEEWDWDKEYLPVPKTYWDELKDSQRLAIMAFAKGAKTIGEAADRAMVSESTIRRWKQDDRFKRLLQAARMATRDRLVNRIDEAGRGDWKANAFLLKTLYREEFGEQRGSVVGNTFNILGRVSLGIDRGDNGISESRDDLIDITPGRLSDESEGVL